MSLMSRMHSLGTMPSTGHTTESNIECSKTGNYLRHLSGLDRETSLLMLEHNYSKPWTWKPETSFAKPTRTLFTTSRPNKTVYDPDEELDIETVDVPSNSQLPCVPEAEDCAKYAEELRAAPGRTPPQSKDDDDWETHVPRIGWTTEHLRLYTTVVRVLHELQMARLALSGRADEAVQRRLAVDVAARRMRRAMASVTWDLRLTHWLHATLQEHMPTQLLAIYLEVLQTLRAKVPSLVDQMLTLSTYNRLGVPVSEELLQLLQKPWDPAYSSIAQHKPRKLPMDPILVMVPSSIGSHIGHSSRRSRFWASQLSLMGHIAPVFTNAGIVKRCYYRFCYCVTPNVVVNLSGQSTVENMLEQLLTLTRAKIDELKTKVPNKPIILFGWHVGAAIACQAALMETVAAVICMGFPISTLAGRRGQADDAILDLQCPIFFVIGQNAPTSRQADLEELRERLRTQSGLLVVGSADERLRVTGYKKRCEGLTQSMVDRCILDEIGDFLGSILTQPPPAPKPPPSPSIKSLTNSTDNQNPRRPSNESSLSHDTEPPDAKKAKVVTPVPVSANSTTPTKTLYSTVKQEAQLALNTTRTVHKRVYEANTSQRIMLGSGGSTNTTEKRGTTTTLGSRQGQSGITVNIGSLASLAPIGPIRLGSSDSESRATPQRSTTSVRVPSTPTTHHTTLTSLSSLLTSSKITSGSNSILLSSNSSSGQTKVLGGEDAVAANQPRTRTLDLSRVTLLTSGSTAKTSGQSGVVMVSAGGTSSSTTISSKLTQNSAALAKYGHLPTASTTITSRVLKQASSVLQSSSPILISSSSTSRPAPSLSPSTILELPVIFAKDGDPDQFAALTAPLPVNLPDDMAELGAEQDDGKTPPG